MKASLGQLVVGALVLLVSDCFLFYIYVNARMVDPRLQGTEYWRTVLGKMFGGVDAGVLSWPLLALFLYGGFMIVQSLIQLVRLGILRASAPLR